MACAQKIALVPTPIATGERSGLTRGCRVEQNPIRWVSIPTQMPDITWNDAEYFAAAPGLDRRGEYGGAVDAALRAESIRLGNLLLLVSGGVEAARGRRP